MATGRMLMIVENTELFKICWQIISSIKIEVFARASCKTARDDIKRFEPHVILIDNGCFKGDHDTVEEIRSIAEFREIPILFLIDHYGDEILVHKTKKDYVLVKPFSLEELVDCVNQAIDDPKKREFPGLTG